MISDMALSSLTGSMLYSSLSPGYGYLDDFMCE